MVKPNFNIEKKFNEQTIINAAVVLYLKEEKNLALDDIAEKTNSSITRIGELYRCYGKPIEANPNNVNHELFYQTRDLNNLTPDYIIAMAKMYFYHKYKNLSGKKISKIVTSFSSSSILGFIKYVVPRILLLEDENKIKILFLKELDNLKSTLAEDEALDATIALSKAVKDENIINQDFESVLTDFNDIKIRFQLISETVNKNLEYFLDNNLISLNKIYDKLNSSLELITAKEYITKNYNSQFSHILKASEERMKKLNSLYYDLLSKSGQTTNPSIELRSSENREMILAIWKLIGNLKGDSHE